MGRHRVERSNRRSECPANEEETANVLSKAAGSLSEKCSRLKVTLLHEGLEGLPKDYGPLLPENIAGGAGGRRAEGLGGPVSSPACVLVSVLREGSQEVY